MQLLVVVSLLFLNGNPQNKGMNKKQQRVILGIDPGTTIMGFGIVSVEGKSIELLEVGSLSLKRGASHGAKLRSIFERTLKLIDDFHPDELAIEAPFFGKNVQSMLKLGRAQGVAIAAAVYRDIPMTEYLPKKIKQSITGSGNASKQQVAAMLESILKTKDLPEDLDATDGLAAAVCHYFQTSNGLSQKGKVSGWASYVKNNPDKIKS